MVKNYPELPTNDNQLRSNLLGLSKVTKKIGSEQTWCGYNYHCLLPHSQGVLLNVLFEFPEQPGLLTLADGGVGPESMRVPLPFLGT